MRKNYQRTTQARVTSRSAGTQQTLPTWLTSAVGQYFPFSKVFGIADVGLCT